MNTPVGSDEGSHAHSFAKTISKTINHGHSKEKVSISNNATNTSRKHDSVTIGAQDKSHSHTVTINNDTMNHSHGFNHNTENKTHNHTVSTSNEGSNSAITDPHIIN